MEADLQRFYGVDYRDRWRPGAALTLRRIGMLLRHLPPEAALRGIARDGNPHWTVEAHLLDDLRLSLTGSKKNPAKRHPARPRPQPKTPSPARARKLADARRRAAARRQAIEAGDIT